MENNVNALLRRAYDNVTIPGYKINDKLTLKEATLDGSWKKHGFHSNAGSYLQDIGYDPEVVDMSEQEWVEKILFKDSTANYKGETHKGEWKISLFSASKNIAILKLNLIESEIHGFEAFMNAAALETLPKDQLCKVESLGAHPTLVTNGGAQETAVITVIIELDGSKDPDLGAACHKLKGEPIIATWFPGPRLPISEPHDCEVGDTLTVEEALKKGWKTVAFSTAK
jgi:hypothetical protein